MHLPVQLALLALLAAGCGGPSIADGTIQCSAEGTCPPGFGCRGDGFCYRSGGGGGGGADARDPLDGASIDAPVDAPPDAPVDAVPVACTSDAECDSLDTMCGDAYCDTADHLCKATPINQGATCLPRSCPGGFSGCANDGSCNTSGSQSRTCVDYTCQGTNCTGANVVETQGCTVDTNGNPCGGDYCDAFPGGCPDDLTTECDQDGSRSRACYVQRCGSGSCQAVYDHSETQGCTRSTDGNVCGPGTSCPGFDGTCDDCQEARTCTDFRCGGGTCNGTPRVETQPCVQGTSCGFLDCDGICGIELCCNASGFCTGNGCFLGNTCFQQCPTCTDPPCPF